MATKLHHAPLTVSVPPGFTGWWCARCERAVDVPDEYGSPARCPRCHKITAVWVPPLGAPASWPAASVAEPTQRRPAREWFTRMRAAVNAPESEAA